MRNEELFSLKVSYILHFHKAKATSNIDSYCKFFPYGKLRASRGRFGWFFLSVSFSYAHTMQDNKHKEQYQRTKEKHS